MTTATKSSGIGKRVRERRLEMGLTALALARKIGMSEFTLSRIENGRFPSVSNLHKLAAALGVGADYLLADEKIG